MVSVCVCVCGGGDWLREGCLIPSSSVIGREAWPHLKAGLLQFIDCGASPRCSHTSAWPRRRTRSAGSRNVGGSEDTESFAFRHTAAICSCFFFFIGNPGIPSRNISTVNALFCINLQTKNKKNKQKTLPHASNVCLI